MLWGPVTTGLSCVAPLRSLFAALALTLGLGGLLAGGSEAEAGTLYISVEEGVAIGGYDPVSFFLSAHPQEGRADHVLMWKGAVWRFASDENRLRFESNPRAYAPRFGGHCAYGIARGHVVAGDPLIWEIVDGRLYMFNSQRAVEQWHEAQAALIHEASDHWPEIMRSR